MDTTSEFSFILKPSSHGVGVFAVHNILKGTHLRLFGDGKTMDSRSVEREKAKVPEIFQQYCVDRGSTLLCPLDFSHMHIGWHLNHSNEPNAIRNDDYKWFALKEIKAGDEITIDYNSLEEPEESKESYY